MVSVHLDVLLIVILFFVLVKLVNTQKCPNQLFTRPYSTVPYMGRGPGNTKTEYLILELKRKMKKVKIMFNY